MAETREQELHNFGCGGTMGEAFFEKFPDTQEMVGLAVTIGVRKLIGIICNSETAPKDVIPAVRLLALLNGKAVGDEDPATGPGSDGISSELLEAVRRNSK